ncbi:MAG: glycosyltransferase [Flavobacterium sp.]|nr:MAG: glycosyltransferase [Flavobacterium sp.]
MKILHVSGAKGWGGNEQQMIDLLPELNKLNEVENLIIGINNSVLQEKANDIGLEFISISDKKLKGLRAYRAFSKLIKTLKPDIIHLHTSDSLTFFVITDLLYGIDSKAVFSKKGMGSSSSFFSSLKYRYKKISKIICVSQAVKKSFQEKFKNENLVVIYDGVNSERVNRIYQVNNLREQYNLDDRILIGNIANHVPAKDLITLIKTINVVVKKLKFTNFHLIQIGEFNDKVTPQILNLIKELDLEDYITLTNFKDNAVKYLEQFDIYIMSSQREGLPLTIYEAFAKKSLLLVLRQEVYQK